jgi:hypothetical protein
MHKSLTPQSNILLIIVWASVVATFIFSSVHPNKPLMLGVGVIFGIFAGVLQVRALQESKDQFLTSTTALEVRAAMMSSRSGRAATYVLYAAAGSLLLTAFTQHEVVGFGLIAGYAAFAFVRECIALKGCIDLHRAQPNQNPEG